jgi:hypothetical protein
LAHHGPKIGKPGSNLIDDCLVALQKVKEVPPHPRLLKANARAAGEVPPMALRRPAAIDRNSVRDILSRKE